MTNSPHRKRVKHYEEPGDLRELTFSCYQRLPILTNDTWRTMLSTAIDRAATRHRFRLAAFVYMTDHVYLLVYPEPGASRVDQLLSAIKRPFSFRVKQLLIQSGSSLLDKLTVHQRPGVQTFRFWQEGPGYDRNLNCPATVKSGSSHKCVPGPVKGEDF